MWRQPTTSRGSRTTRSSSTTLPDTHHASNRAHNAGRDADRTRRPDRRAFDRTVNDASAKHRSRRISRTPPRPPERASAPPATPLTAVRHPGIGRVPTWARRDDDRVVGQPGRRTCGAGRHDLPGAQDHETRNREKDTARPFAVNGASCRASRSTLRPTCPCAFHDRNRTLSCRYGSGMNLSRDQPMSSQHRQPTVRHHWDSFGSSCIGTARGTSNGPRPGFRGERAGTSVVGGVG
jgi:hypothetical protein